MTIDAVNMAYSREWTKPDVRPPIRAKEYARKLYREILIIDYGARSTCQYHGLPKKEEEPVYELDFNTVYEVVHHVSGLGWVD